MVVSFLCVIVFAPAKSLTQMRFSLKGDHLSHFIGPSSLIKMLGIMEIIWPYFGAISPFLRAKRGS